MKRPGSIYFLVKRLPTDETPKIFVFDVRLDEWQADLARDDSRETVFVREVNDRVAERPWAAFVSLETFGKVIADLETLASMAALSARSRTPVLAAVDPTDPVQAAAWETIRAMAAARYLGAVMPRFLLRLPYGKLAGRW